MILLCLLGVMSPVAADDTYTLTLMFQRMHCDECKREAEGTVKKLPGFVGVTFLETAAVVILADKSPLPAVVGLPKDMGYRGSHLTMSMFIADVRRHNFASSPQAFTAASHQPSRVGFAWTTA